MKKVIITIIAIIGLSVIYSLIPGESNQKQIENKQSTFSFEPIEHATFVAEFAGKTIYFDPNGGGEVFAGKETPELIFITDVHGDHLNIETLESVIAEETKIIAPQAVYDELPQNLQQQTTIISNGENKEIDGISVEAIPMYNLPESEDSYHVKGRGNGYVLEYNEERIYVAGDTENIPEMMELQNIDVAFVPMNLPYTMTIENATEGVLAFAPKTVYPYHYRGMEGLSNVEEFKQLVESQNPNINVVLLNWYPEVESDLVSDNSNLEKTYQISGDSTVSYTSQKEFFSKPTEAITGTTGDIDGVVEINSENSTISVDAVVNSGTFDSGNGARDQYVRDQFDSEISIVSEDQPFNSFGQVNFQADVVLTMNGITRIEQFQISGSISETEIDLVGSTNIDMTNYLIEPASAAGIYTVDDIAEISFDLVANI